MAIVQYNSKERDMLARLMRAEAVGEGELGMLMVGNVVLNRVLANCLTFTNINNITEAVNQNPGGFSGVKSPLYFSNPTTTERKLADRVINGEYFFPATNALWFYAPGSDKECSPTWWDQNLAGRYKSHCFYDPVEDCRKIN